MVGPTVGLEMDAYYFTPRACHALQSSLPESRFVDAHELVNWVRAVKSDAELALMRTAGRIVERTMAAGIQAVAPGVRQCDAVAAIYDAAVRGADGVGGDYPAIVPMLPDRPGDRHSAPDLERRALQARRGHRPGARGLLPALSLPDGADGLPRSPAAPPGRHCDGDP